MMSMRIISYFGAPFDGSCILETASSPIERSIDNAVERVQELATNLATSWVVLNQEDPRLSLPARVGVLRPFSVLGELLSRVLGFLLSGHGVRNVVDVVAVHRVDAVGGAHGVDNTFEFVGVHLGIGHGAG